MTLYEKYAEALDAKNIDMLAAQRLINWRSQAIFTSEGRPLGERRNKPHVGV
jgi:hypothetical protein